MKRLYCLMILALLLLLTACGKTTEMPPNDVGTDKQVETSTNTVSAPLDVIEAMKSVQATDFKNPDEFGNITAQQLADALNHAASFPTAAVPDPFIDQWNIYWAYLEGEGSSNKDLHFRIFCGLEENIVSVSLRKGQDSDRAYFKDETLYELIRHKRDYEEIVDSEAYGRFESILKQQMDSTYAIMESENPGILLGYELTRFNKVLSFVDEITGDTVELYDFDYALLTDAPEDICWAGGMYLDSKLRVQCFNGGGQFAVKYRNSKTVATAFMGNDFIYDPDTIYSDEDTVWMKDHILSALSVSEQASDGASTNTLEPPQSGKAQVFERNGLKLEVTNVHSVRKETMLDHGEDPHEYSVFTCYPGATITILDAGMSDPTYAEDGKAYPQWGLYYSDETEKTRISDDTTPVPVTTTLEGVYNLEASLYVLTFEFVDAVSPGNPYYEDVGWPVVSKNADDLIFGNSLEDPKFEYVFMNTNTVPLDQLVAFLMVADGLSEGAADEMYHRFMEAPHTVLNYLASLGTQTKKLPVLGDVVVAEWICQDIASADVAWYGATDAFIRLVEDCKSTYSGDRVSELLDLLELEHKKAYGRLLKDAEETSKSVDTEYIQEAVNRIFVGELSYDPSWTHPGTYSLTATENAGGAPDKYTISPVPYYSIWSTPGYRLATEFFWNEVTTSESAACSGCGYTFRFACGQRAITVCSHENLLEIEQNGAKRFFRGTPLNLNTHSDYSEIFNMFLQYAETAEYEHAQAVRCSVDGSITDYSVVAQKLAEQYAEISINRPDWFSRRAEDAVVSGANIFDAYYGKDMPNFCFVMGLKLKLTDTQRQYWEAGSGLAEPPTTGEYAGYYGWGAEVSVKKGADGNWHITGLATGGSMVDVPYVLSEANVKQLVELYFLTEGQTRDWHILRELAEHPLDDVRAELNALDPTQAQELRQGVLGFMESYPDYHTWSPSDFA